MNAMAARHLIPLEKQRLVPAIITRGVDAPTDQDRLNSWEAKFSMRWRRLALLLSIRRSRTQR